MSHTVDEVSELLEVPRPTLYRYLKEYSIPHIRRSGKIYVPEESFERIKEARELHKEGLGTESVRRRLQGKRSDLDEELAQRLDRISGTLENLQVNLKPANSESFAQTLQAISVKQDLLISAMFDLTEMLEGLLAANRRSPKAAPLEDPEEEMQKQGTSF
ncbi:MAG TPA: helix-turn-helix domain-containing protein [Rubrobacteraceae bacterium]|nr:helix-turn-helix domain-containing protein [Rubrobacteraceae bacterium]